MWQWLWVNSNAPQVSGSELSAKRVSITSRMKQAISHKKSKHMG